MPGRFFQDPFRNATTVFCLCDLVIEGRTIRHFASEYLKTTPVFYNIKLEAAIEFSILDKAEEDSGQNDFLKKVNECRYLASPRDRFANVRSEIMELSQRASVDVSSHYYGTKYGQSISVLNADNFLAMADNLLIFRYIVENVSDSYGVYAIFNTNPYITNELLLSLTFSDLATEVAPMFLDSLKRRSHNILCLLPKLPNNKSQYMMIDDFNTTANSVDIRCCVDALTNPYFILTSFMFFGLGRGNSLADIFSDTLLNKYLTTMKSL